MALANLALVVAVEGTAKAAAESRAMIGGTIALVLARCLSRHATAFPAILPATLTLLEHDDGNPAAVHDFGGTVFGAVGLIAFALVAAMIFGTCRRGALSRSPSPGGPSSRWSSTCCAPPSGCPCQPRSRGHGLGRSSGTRLSPGRADPPTARRDDAVRIPLKLLRPQGWVLRGVPQPQHNVVTELLPHPGGRVQAWFDEISAA